MRWATAMIARLTPAGPLNGGNRRRVGIADLDGGPGALHQLGAQPTVAMAGGAGKTFAGALVVAGTELGPTGKVTGGGKAAHVNAGFGQNVLGQPEADPGQHRQRPGRRSRSKRRGPGWRDQPRGLDWPGPRRCAPRCRGRRRQLIQIGADLRIEAADLLVQIVELDQVFGDDEAMVRAHPPRQSLFQQVALARKRPRANSANRRAWLPATIASTWAGRHAGDITDHRTELEIGPLQRLLQAVDHRGAILHQVRPLPGQSRRSRWGRGGMKLLRSKPCRRRSAIHSASLTSVLRPGTFLICWALTTSSSK